MYESEHHAQGQIVLHELRDIRKENSVLRELVMSLHAKIDSIQAHGIQTWTCKECPNVKPGPLTGKILPGYTKPTPMPERVEMGEWVKPLEPSCTANKVDDDYELSLS